METNKDIEHLLDTSAPQALSVIERERVWNAVEKHIATPIPSPYHYLLINTKIMVPLILVLALLLGAGGTVAASDDARPGDFLFPVDRAVEDMRLALASEHDKSSLKIRFADERLREFESIVDEEVGDTTLTGTLTEAEADIFTNETIVKLEAGDTKVSFSTDATTREEIIAVIVNGYGFTEADVDALLVVQTEDRESRSDDTGVSDSARLRLDHALTVLNDFVSSTLDSASTSPDVIRALEVVEARLLERSNSLPGEFRAKVRDDRARFEIRDGENRVRVEIKDGEVRIKSDDNSGTDSDHDDDSDRVNSSSSLEIEADVFTDTTLVKVKVNGRTTLFSTDADTRDEVIAAIHAKYPSFTEDEIDAVLDLGIEDRASTVDDTVISNSSLQSDDDDEDNDDDSSGHGGDDDDDGDSGHSGSSGKGSGDDD